MKSIIKDIPEIERLFPLKTAGRDMVTDIPVFLEHATTKQIRDHLLKHAKDYKTINYLYIVDKETKLQGVLSMKELFQARSSKSIKVIMNKKPIHVTPLTKEAEVARLSIKHHLKMVPILDSRRRLLGAVNADMLSKILYRKFGNQLMAVSGVSTPRKHFHYELSKIFLARFPWILIGLFGGLLTGSIIGFFRSSLESVIALAVFIPVIMTVGATTANQSAMIFIRNLIYGDIKKYKKYIVNEFKLGLVLGFVVSLIAFILIQLFASTILAFVVAVSMFLTILASSFIGMFTPWVLHHYELDPSIGAGPFLTIIKDLIAMTIYFSVATMLLQYLT